MFILKLPDSEDGVNQMIFTGDCLFEGGVGMFFEGVPAQMVTILDRMLTIFDSNAVRERCAMFFGHDYGFKNYVWAADHVFGDKQLSADAEINELKERIVARKDALLAKRRAGFANTGTLLSEELASNPFMVAHRQAMQETEWEKQTFLNFVRFDYQEPQQKLDD